MTYLQQQLADLEHTFPDVPLEALKAAMISGIEAFAWYKDGVQYVGTCGTKRKDAVKEILNWRVSSQAAAANGDSAIRSSAQSDLPPKVKS